MASPTRKTKRIRKTKLSKQGKERKRLARREGSTKSDADLFGDKK